MLKNLFADLPESLSEEIAEVILQTDTFTLERIISEGQRTPPGEWYDQQRDEWVLLLKGSAGLRIEGRSTVHVLRPGDYILIPAHVRHRVEWTEGAGKTVWLALHFGG